MNWCVTYFRIGRCLTIRRRQHSTVDEAHRSENSLQPRSSCVLADSLFTLYLSIRRNQWCSGSSGCVRTWQDAISIAIQQFSNGANQPEKNKQQWDVDLYNLYTTVDNLVLVLVLYYWMYRSDLMPKTHYLSMTEKWKNDPGFRFRSSSVPNSNRIFLTRWPTSPYNN